MPDPTQAPGAPDGVTQADALLPSVQGPASPAAAPAVTSADDRQAALTQSLDGDQELQDLLKEANSTPKDDETAKALAPVNPPGNYSRLGAAVSNILGGVMKTKQAYDSATQTLGEGVARGIGSFGHEALKSAAAFSDNLTYATGLYKVGTTPEEQNAYLRWMELPARQREHLMFGVDLSGGTGEASKWMGQPSNSWSGLIEGVTQFSLGMATLESVLPEAGAGAAEGAAGTAKAAGKAVLDFADKAALNAAKGGAAMMAFFSPYAKRFADTTSGPFAPIAHLLPNYLKSNPDDPEAIGRLKNGLEGMLLGSTIDTAVALLKGTWHFYAGNAEGVAKSVQEAHTAATTPHPDDVLTAKPTEDGGATVIINGKRVPAPEPSSPGGTPSVRTDSLPPSGTPVGPEAGTNAGGRVSSGTPIFRQGTPESHAPGAADTMEKGLHFHYGRDKGGYERLGREGLAAEAVPSNPLTIKGVEDTPGAAALKTLAPDEWAKVKNMEPADLEAYVKEQFPDASLASAGNRNSLFELIGARRAREAGHDAILMPDREEFVALKESAIKRPETGLEDTAPKVEGKTDIANAPSDTKPLSGMDKWQRSNNIAKEKKLNAPLPEASAEGGVSFTREDFAKMDFGEILASLGLKEEGGGLKFASPAEAEQAAATANYALKHGSTPPGKLAAEDVPAFQKALQKYQKTRDPRDAAAVLDQYGFNPNYIQQPKDVVDVMKALVDVFPEPSTVDRGSPESWAETLQKTRQVFDDIPPEKVEAWAAQHADNLQDAPKMQLALRLWTWNQGQRVAKLAQMAGANPGNALAQDQLAAALDTLMHLHADMAGAASGLGRGLNIQKVPLAEAANALGEVADISGHRAPAGRAVTQGMTPEEIQALGRAVMYADGDPSVIGKIVSGPLAPPEKIRASPTLMQQFKDFTTAWRMEAMISAALPKKLIADVVVGLTKPAEYMWAGFNASFGDNPEAAQRLFQQGTDMYAGIWGNLGDSIRAGAKTFKVGHNILEPGYNFADTSKGLGALGENGWLQTIGRMPSRAMMSADELAKNLNYRMYMRSQIVAQARAEGVTDAAEIASRLNNDMKVAFDPQGGAVNAKALDYAKLNTFTSDLEGTAKKLQEIQQSSWLAKQFVPFWRTPVNIFNYTWERTPILNMLNQRMRADIAAGGERAALARARAQMGLTMFTAAGLAAGGGLITGAGPGDLALRKEMKSFGWQPYSIKVGDNYVSYQHSDPYFMPLGIMADLYQMAGSVDQQRHSDYLAMVLGSLSSAFTSRSYMEGVTETMDAMTHGQEGQWHRVLAGILPSYVPTAVSHANPDSVIRETRSYLDEVLTKLPWFSTQLEPTFNIFGEPVLKAPGTFNRGFNPFTVRPGIKPNSVDDELIKLGRALPMPPNMIAENQVDMKDRDAFPSPDGKSPYRKMMEAIGAGPGNLPPLRTKLTELINSDKYKNAPGSDDRGPGGLRLQMVSTIVRTWQAAAMAQVLSNDDRLKEAYIEANKAAGFGKAQGQSAYETSLDEVNKKWGTDLFTPPRKKAR